jgi:anti-sigma factor RsiW
MSHGDKKCLEMVDLLSDYIDGNLDAGMRGLIEEHGGECPPCRSFIRTLKKTVEAVRKQPRSPLPEKLRSALAEALRKAR